MEPIHVSLLVHFIGIGMIFTSLFGGWIVTGHYRKAADWKTKAAMLRVLRPIGLFSPAAIVVMIVSGFGNMGLLGYGVFTAAWLSAKLVFFLIMAVAGVIGGVKGGRRGKLVAQMAEGSAPEGSERVIASLDKQQRLFSAFQAIILLIILVLSIVKPHA